MVVEFGVIQAEKLAGKLREVLVDAGIGKGRISDRWGIANPIYLSLAAAVLTGRRQPDRNPLQLNQLPEPPRRLEPDAACLDFQGASLAMIESSECQTPSAKCFLIGSPRLIVACDVESPRRTLTASSASSINCITARKRARSPSFLSVCFQ